ncbi:hypothetical protein Hanom_Chr07g00583561 [Helianthus anomalus]
MDFLQGYRRVIRLRFATLPCVLSFLVLLNSSQGLHDLHPVNIATCQLGWFVLKVTKLKKKKKQSKLLFWPLWLYHFYPFSSKKNFLTSEPPTSIFLTLLAPYIFFITILAPNIYR